MSRSHALVLALVLIGCGGNNDSGGGGDGGTGGGDGGSHNLGITVTPDPANLDLNQGGPAVSQTFKAVAHLAGGDSDVSAQAIWSIDDLGLGSMTGKTFTSGTTRGGTTLVHARFTPPGGSELAGIATLNVKLHATVTTTCPGCAPFPATTTPACTGMAADPTLVYPPDGVLLPPNMNVIEVHYLPGAGNALFEIDFQNAATDVRVETMCTPVTNTRGTPTMGCAYQLDPMVWGLVASSNKGGDAVKVTVRAAPANGACVAGSNSRNILFAQDNLEGGIYYWQSVVQGGVAGKTGGIFRHDFGTPMMVSEPFLTPGTTNKCVGCHALSRDGKRMTFGSDDADSDDEYGDLKMALYDVATRTTIKAGLTPGFQALLADHTRFLASDGLGAANPPVFQRFDGDTGAALANVAFPALMGKRVTQPDWSKDGGTVYFTVAGSILTNIGAYNRKDDLHFMAGAIDKMSYDVAAGTFGPETVVVPSASVDQNNYYPSISPDGQFVVFNRATGTTLEAHDDFNNQSAHLFALKLGGTPVDMARANYKDGMTNSWPRWSPFVQTYKGKRLLWVTFSSTRDYGLRVENESPPDGPLMNCYPPESPENPAGAHSQPFPPNCTQPQIWMAAVSLTDLEFGGADPSFPAFWLPFQDVTAHNHIAQWTETVVTGPPGLCVPLGGACPAADPCCAGLGCNMTAGMCEALIP